MSGDAVDDMIKILYYNSPINIINDVWIVHGYDDAHIYNVSCEECTYRLRSAVHTHLVESSR